MAKKRINITLVGIAITLLLTLIAELYRFHGILLLDLWLPIFASSWLILNFKKIRIPKVTIPAAFFILIGLASLLVNASTDFTSSFLYIVRWASLFSLLIITFNEKDKDTTSWLLIIFALLLSIAGFIQLRLVPDFRSFEYLGWDPHQGRLLSTWFDPNFVGGFLAFIIPITIGFTFDKKSHVKYLIPIAILLSIALLLTLSRSSYLAFLAGMTIFSLIKSRKLLFLLGLFLILAVGLIQPVQERAENLYESISAVITDDYTLPDASARLRFGSWEEAWNLFSENPLIGHGYNRYSEAAQELGTQVDPTIHSATGSDSSLLTILATTGILGFLPFIYIYLSLIGYALKNRSSGFAAGYLGGICGLFIHSIFVNSLLFPLLSIPFWIASGLLLKSTRN